MLYLSKQFHLQHKYLNRCLNGVIVSLFFVVMSGCEHIRLHDLSSGGTNTLFYIASGSDQTIDLKSMTAASSDSENLNSQVNLNTEQQAETQSDLVNSDEVLALKSETEPSTEVTELSFFDRLFTKSQYVDKQEEKDSVVKDSVLELKSDASAQQDLLIAEVNKLNTLNPSAAGQADKLFEPLVVPVDIQEKNNSKNKPSFPTISKDLKKALASTRLEILQWQLEMQKSSNDGIDCRLSSPTLQIESHQYTTQLWLNIENDRLFVNATTDIDPKLPFVGIHFDNGRFEPFSSGAHPLYAIWEGDLADLIKSNKKMNLVLSGNDLKSQIQLASIDLSALRQIYPKYLACAKRLIGH